MATIDLGKIKLVWRGTYAGGTAYAVDDVVGHTDGGLTSSFICTTASTGNAPSTGGTVHGSWAYLAKGGAAGTNGTDVGTVITTAGDLLYRDGSGLQRLAKGTASQVLTMNSGATAPEWAAADTSPTTTEGDIIYRGGSADVRLAKGTAGQFLKMNSGASAPEWSSSVAGVVKKIHYAEFGTRTAGNNSAANQDHFDWGSFTVLDAANNSLFVTAVVPINSENQNWAGYGLRFAGSSINVDTFGLGTSYNSNTSYMGMMNCQFVLPANTLNNNGGWTVYFRTQTTSSEPDIFCPNSSDDSRLGTQTKATLTMIEYKN